jgi:hypothetical protein
MYIMMKSIKECCLFSRLKNKANNGLQEYRKAFGKAAPFVMPGLVVLALSGRFEMASQSSQIQNLENQIVCLSLFQTENIRGLDVYEWVSDAVASGSISEIKIPDIDKKDFFVASFDVMTEQGKRNFIQAVNNNISHPEDINLVYMDHPYI